jgi:hypothetical protein
VGQKINKMSLWALKTTQQNLKRESIFAAQQKWMTSHYLHKRAEGVRGEIKTKGGDFNPRTTQKKGIEIREM